MVLLRNASDAWVDESRPTRNFSNTRRLYVKATGSAQRFAYIYFHRPFPIGATILSAKLRVYNGSTFEGTAALQVNRIKEKWSVNRIRWNKKPDVYATMKTLTKTDAAPGTEWEIDVTTVMQKVADGAGWFGFRITTDNGPGEWFHSAQSTEKYRPTLEVTWSDAPQAPEVLSPGGGRAVSVDKPFLSFDFTDVSGDTSLAACKIEIGSTQALVEAGSAEWKSPELPVTEPEVDLTTTTYPGLANNGTAFWRVMVKDGAGLWSDWSEVTSFMRVDKSALSMSNPPAIVAPATYSTVGDATPPVFWTFSGTQVAYQVIISRADSKGEWLWTSGKISSTSTDITIPAKVIKREDVLYNIRLRIWDNVNREKEGDRPIYTEVSRDFMYDSDLATAGVTSLAATAETPWPWMKLEWDRADAPDSFEIWRGEAADDLELVAKVDSDVPFVSGTHYLYRDRFARGRTKQYWEVRAVVNNKASGTNPQVNGTPRSASRWLMEEDGSNAIMLVNPAVSKLRGDNSTVHTTLSGESILVSQYNAGLAAGEVKGLLANEVVPGLTAKQMFKRYKAIIKQSGQPLILFNVDETLRVFITQPNWEAVARPDGTTEYIVTFKWYEMGDDQ